MKSLPESRHEIKAGLINLFYRCLLQSYYSFMCLDKNTKPRHINIALLQSKINLAQQQDRSNFNSDISLNHLANLQLKVFFYPS